MKDLSVKSINKISQSLGFNLSNNIFSPALAISVFYLVFFVGSVKADLNTAPPIVLPVKQQNQTQIESLIVKANNALGKKFLTRPENINAVYYVEQILLLSPKEKRAFDILTKVCDIYTSMAYRRLKENKIALAQRHYYRAIKIVRQFNLYLYDPKMANLQREISLRRKKIIQLIAELKKAADVSEFPSNIEKSF